ncbi:site-specific tyrosine recombinase/integron integrase [Pleomorphovibrio marinus]|uniref:site-specific tyrosine recombinase/integron integrase n=1 Tax=Pleomorphovibrio marinus TaxID=2164132 RepID=UPI000E0B490C|nr:site-specific tyrosine recombinase/integron integrase [Pleomorphovibrio marinus]
MWKTIILRNDTFNKLPVIRLEFPFDVELKELVKGFPESMWYAKEQVWAAPYTPTQLSALLDYFKGKQVWLDYSSLKKVEIREKYTELPMLGEELQLEIQRFKDWLRNRRYSESTIKTYSEAVALFFRFLDSKPPSSITNEDLEVFNRDYIIKRNYSVSYQSQVINGVKLYFGILEDRQLDPDIIKRPRRPKRLPEVLSKQEVKAILEALSNPKHRLILLLLYSCGLRRGEVLNLKTQDIQPDRGIIVVKKGKGNKDRIVRFPEVLHAGFNAYLKAEKPVTYLFEGQGGGQYGPRSLAEVLNKAVKRAGINKPVTPHWLRHSYATHLHEGGTDIRYIQEVLGHKSSRTTEIYTHVSNREIKEIRSPIEDMDIDL